MSKQILLWQETRQESRFLLRSDRTLSSVLKRYRIESIYYDKIYDSADDVMFYHSYVKLTGGPVLECGSGTGRIAIPLAQAGYDVVGIDVSPEMLSVARAKIGTIRGNHGHITFERADMRDFRLGRKFAVCLIPFFAFHHLLTDDDQLNALKSIRRHLRHGGLLILTIFNPELNKWPEDVRVVERSKTTEDGTLVRSFIQQIEREKQIIHGKFFIDHTTDNDTTRSEIEFVLRYLTLGEAKLRLQRTGFITDAVFGNYTKRPFTRRSGLMIIVAHRD